MDLDRYRAICDYVEFTEQTSSVLRALSPFVDPHLPRLIDDFYEAIDRDERARQVITGGDAQVARLKVTLLRWLTTLLAGPHDEAYVESRNQIGRVHVRIGLPQEYMFTAANRLRNGLVALVFTESCPVPQAEATMAINKALDVELALMLDTYREDWTSQVDASARLAAIGQTAAGIGHELRSPLGVMESSVYLMNQRLERLGLSDPVLSKHLQRIHAQITVCADAISSLLDMARDAPLQPDLFPLSDFVETCVAQTYRPEDVLISVDVDPGLVTFGDTQQLGRVVNNLLRNAVEAVGASGVIQVGASAAGGGVTLWVEDNGPGVPEALRPRLFEVLFTTRSKGTGLGLALCKRIVERHGGTLAYEVPPTRGARFRLWLPGASAS